MTSWMRAICWTIALASAGAAHASLRIGTITIRVTPLFSAEEVRHGRAYSDAEKLQINVRESLIRRFLLFREGDELDEARVRETERNLRQLDFLRSVSIVVGPPHAGVVDIVVATEDAWTTDIDADYSDDGDRALYDVSVRQKNLFNRGAAVQLRVANELFRHSASIEAFDPQTFGPYWNADAMVAVSSDGNEQRLSIDRPLYSYGAPYTLTASFNHLLQNGHTFQAGEVDTIFRQSHRELLFQGGPVVDAKPESISRVLGGVDLVDDSFRAIQGAEPDGRHFRFLELGFDRTRFHFISLDHVDFGMRKQDFNLGAHAAFFFAVSPPVTGRPTVWRLRSEISWGHAFSASSFVVGSATATSRFGAVNRNTIVSEDARFIMKMATLHPRTRVVRGRLDMGWDLDRDVQFLADGQNGLRAYPDFSFEGSRRVILNAEYRQFLGRELMQLFEPGIAAFADTGEAVNGGFSRRQLRTDFGVGLRCGIARLENAMLRLDLSYAINSSPTTGRGFEVSFATVQAF